MPTLTSTGVGSGLDVNNIVSSLMALERRPLTLLQQQAGTVQTKLSAFGTLKGQVAALGDVAARLADAAAWNPMRVDAGNATAASMTASAKAAPGSYRLEVQQLAQSQVLATQKTWEGASSVVGTGTLRIELGTTSGDTFTPRAGSEPFTVEIGEGNNTLAGVRDAINASSSGVRASIVTSNGAAYLTLRTPEGADSTVRITVQEPDGGDNSDMEGLSALALDLPEAPGTAVRNLRQTQAGQDARFTLDGLELTSANNTPANVIEGVTLTLRQVTTAPVDFNVAVDTAALRKNITDFMNAVNTLTRTVQSQTQADPAAGTRGPLQADSTALGLLGSLRELLRGEVTGASVGTLSAAGMAFQRDGSMATVESRLAALLDQPAELARLFTQAGDGEDPRSRGLALRLKDWAKAIAGDQGSLDSRVTSLNGSTRLLQKQRDAMEEKLARTEARLRAQYQRLDTQMAQLNGQLGNMRAVLGLD